MTKQVAFLFGAGAEAGKYNFDQLTGSSYFDATIIEDQSQILNELQKKFNSIYFGSCKYSKHQIYRKNFSEKKLILNMLKLYLKIDLMK